MWLEILDKKTLEGRTWALCKGNLLEYLQGLKTDFFEFSVQRKIVNNAYLDTIYKSVEKGEPLPPITLTYQDDINAKVGEKIAIDEQKVEILDGLQRTYRLWVVLYLADVIKKSADKSLKGIAIALKQSRDGEVVLENSFMTPKFMRGMLEQKEDNRIHIVHLLESYGKFDVYFNIWTRQDDQQIIRRMLILNAGQKQVSSTHQFELLFLHFFEDQKLHYDQQKIVLVREKDKRFRSVQRGERDKGEFLMSSVVIALQSFINGRQLRISTVNKINLDDNKLLNHEKLEQYFNAKTLSEFITHLYNLGDLLSKKSPKYVHWYGKDTVLSGIFGAMGSFLIENGYEPDVSSIGRLMLEIDKYKEPFHLLDYYDAYSNKLASTKVNVGNAVRKAIFNYTKDLLTMGKSDWYRQFDTSGNYDEE
jgi:hypothetical protein